MLRGSATSPQASGLRSLRRPLRHDHAPLVGQQVLQADVQGRLSIWLCSDAMPCVAGWAVRGAGTGKRRAAHHRG